MVKLDKILHWLYWRQGSGLDNGSQIAYEFNGAGINQKWVMSHFSYIQHTHSHIMSSDFQ